MSSFQNFIDGQIAKLDLFQSIIICMNVKAIENTDKSNCSNMYQSVGKVCCDISKVKEALFTQKELWHEENKDLEVEPNLCVENISAIEININDEPTSCDTSQESEATPFKEPSLWSNSYKYNISPDINPQYSREIFRKPIQMRLEIEPLSEDEYRLIPKYMVNRIGLDAINRFIELLNKTMMKKYNLLAKPRSSLKPRENNLYLEYKRQETTDLKCKSFVVDADIAAEQGRKVIDKNSSNILTMLRHTKRIYEIRASGIVRYVLHS